MARRASTDYRRAALRPKLQASVDRMLERTERALRFGAQVVGWQESSAWVLEEDRQGVVLRAAELARRHDAYLQISLEVFTRTGRLPYLRNQSILVDPSGSVRWTYDSYYPALIRQAGAGGADILLAPFNDIRPFASYFLAIATYRAIENGFSMLRLAGLVVLAARAFVRRRMPASEKKRPRG